MKNLIYVLIAICAFVVVSCSNADLLTMESNADLSKMESNAEAITDFEEYLTITYKGKTYQSIPTAYDARKNFVFLDEEFSSSLVINIFY